MPEPMYWRKKTLIAKIETTYGVDAGPSAALNAILATEIRHMPMEGADTSRNLDTSYMGAQPTLPTELHSKFTFNVELVGSGTAGTAPAWGPLMRACGMAEVIAAGAKVTYSPVSAGHESLTIYFNVDGTVYKSTGVRGTAKITVNAQGIPVIAFEMTGLFAQPATDTFTAGGFGAWQQPQVVTSANTPEFTVDGVSMVMRNFELDLGCDVQRRFLVGSEGVLIVDRAETIQATVEAVPLPTFNPYLRAASGDTFELALTHGTVVGQKVRIATGNAQMQRPAGLENAQGITEWPLRFIPLPAQGNDQFTITLT